jgi:hypothetical protein
MKKNKFPKGWDEERVQKVISFYESQTDEEAVAEDEVTYEQKGYSMVEVPIELLPTIRNIIAHHQSDK